MLDTNRRFDSLGRQRPSGDVVGVLLTLTVVEPNERAHSPIQRAELPRMGIQERAATLGVSLWQGSTWTALIPKEKPQVWEASIDSH